MSCFDLRLAARRRHLVATPAVRLGSPMAPNAALVVDAEDFDPKTISYVGRDPKGMRNGRLWDHHGEYGAFRVLLHAPEQLSVGRVDIYTRRSGTPLHLGVETLAAALCCDIDPVHFALYVPALDFEPPGEGVRYSAFVAPHPFTILRQLRRPPRTIRLLAMAWGSRIGRRGGR